MWFLNYFVAKFLEILKTGSLETGKFLQKQSVSIFQATAHALHLTVFLNSVTKKKQIIAGFFASLCIMHVMPFSPQILIMIVKAISTLHSIIEKNSTDSVGVE